MTSPLHIRRFHPDAMRLITAKHNGTASCGHAIIAGDEIGYDPQSKRTRCNVCAAAITEREAMRKQRAANERMKVE